MSAERTPCAACLFLVGMASSHGNRQASLLRGNVSQRDVACGQPATGLLAQQESELNLPFLSLTAYSFVPVLLLSVVRFLVVTIKLPWSLSH